MRILYLMHVNWYWIRQRPHIFAELLSKTAKLKLLHFCMFRKGHKSPERAPDFLEASLLRVPDRLLQTFRLFGWINRIVIAAQVRSAARSIQPSIVWVTHPIFYPAIARLSGCKIVYDCMDDHSQFSSAAAAHLVELENALLARADLTIFSSQTLATRITARFRPDKYAVVNNGVSESLVRRLEAASEREASHPRNTICKMGYFGTISHWFDWPLIFSLLERFPNLHLELAGPIEVEWVPHERVHYKGIFAAGDLANFVDECEFLVMPFIVNELIKSVDPVKLYEYIAYNKPSLAPRYPETERFSPWVSLYNSIDDAAETVDRLLRSHSGHAEIACKVAFLNENTWENRGAAVLKIIDVLEHRDGV